VIPGSGAGVYTIWDDAGGLVYTGIAGRNPAGKGLASRLRSHASGRRSGDQFCIYVCDRLVIPTLTPEQIQAVGAGTLLLDALTKQHIREFRSYRFVATTDSTSAFRLERLVQGGALDTGKPILNPR
jgi:hypothetical protein